MVWVSLLRLACWPGAGPSGPSADGPRGACSVKTTIREQFAKFKAVLDVIIRRKPRFLGKKEVLP